NVEELAAQRVAREAFGRGLERRAIAALVECPDRRTGLGTEIGDRRARVVSRRVGMVEKVLEALLRQVLQRTLDRRRRRALAAAGRGLIRRAALLSATHATLLCALSRRRSQAGSPLNWPMLVPPNSSTMRPQPGRPQPHSATQPSERAHVSSSTRK